MRTGLVAALQLVEVGRGIISGQLMETREDIGGLLRQHPMLAAHVIKFRHALNPPKTSMISIDPQNATPWQPQASERQEAERNIEKLV